MSLNNDWGSFKSSRRLINNNPLRLIERGERLFIDRRRECRNSIVAMFYAFEGSWNASFPRRSNGIAETVYWIVKGIKSMESKESDCFFFFFFLQEMKIRSL